MFTKVNKWFSINSKGAGSLDFLIDNPGHFLKEKRKESKLTLRQLSEFTSLTPGYISRIENGSSAPSLEAIYKLSKALHFNVEDICSFSKIDFNKEEPIAIEDVFQANIKIGDKELSNFEKIQIVKLLKEIYQINWNDEINKLSHIGYILKLVNELGKSSRDINKKENN